MRITLAHTFRLGTAVLAGSVTTGLLAFPVSAVAAGDDDVAAKRNEDSADVVVVSDDDGDDDTGTNGDDDTAGTNTGGTNTGTGTNSGDQNDPTNSNVTAPTQGDDNSNGDLTRDMTRDGAGAKKRDWSQNHTNDNSRNDTRG